MRQHPNRPLRRAPGFFAHQIAHSLLDRFSGIAEMIFATKIGNVRTLKRPERMNIEYPGHLRQIQVHKKKSVLKHIRSGPEAAVPDVAFIDEAMHVFP